MKKTNQILSILLAVIMVVCMLPVSVSAADLDTFTDADSGLNFMIQNEEECKVSVHEGNYTASHYEIPSSVVYNGKTYTVIFIEEIAFSGCTSIDSLVIPSSVTHMGGPNVFKDCDGLDIKVMVQGDKLDLSSYDGISSVSYQYDAPMNANCSFDGVAKWQGLETTDVRYKLTLVKSGQLQPVAEAYVESNANSVDYTYQFTDVTFDEDTIYYLNVQAVKPEGSQNGVASSTVAQAAMEGKTYNVDIFTTVLNFGEPTDIGGSISGAGSYKEGDTVTLTASPNDGYCAIGWGSNQNVELPSGSQSTMTVTFTMPAEDVQITGSFRAHTLGVFYKDLENGTHDSYCFYCGERENNPTGHIDLTDYTGEGEPDGSCDACGAEMHTHSYSSEWSKDASGHWHECECGDKADFAEHTSSGAASYGVPETCTICGYRIAPAKTTYSLTLNYEIYANDGSIIGSGIESKTIEFAPGTVVDLSEYWSEQMTSISNDGKTYYFGMFSYNADGSGKVYNNFTITEDTVMYASWVTTPMITLAFETNNGTMPYAKLRVKMYSLVGEVNSIHIPTRSGYTFLGWSLENDGIADSGGIQLTENCTLYAVWQSGSDEPPATDIPVKIGGEEYKVPISDGTAFIVDRDDITDGSVSKVDMTPIKSTTTLTKEQAATLIQEWCSSFMSFIDVNVKERISEELKEYSLADLELIRNILRREKHGLYGSSDLLKLIKAEIANRQATNLVIAPGYINSTSDFKVTTGQGLGVTYSNDALTALLAFVGSGSNVKVETKLEKAELTLDEAKEIVRGWLQIVGTSGWEDVIKNQLSAFNQYELALLDQATTFVIEDDSIEATIDSMLIQEMDRQFEQTILKANEKPLAAFSVNTYAVAADGTQTYISVQKSMQYTIPVDTSSIPENATLALYRLNEDGTRTKQEIISNENGLVIANTDGNSDYILVYELAEEQPTSPGTPSSPQTGDNSHMWLWFGLMLASGFALAGTWIYGRKRKIN